MKLKSLGALIVIFFALSGCEQISNSVSEFWNSGTLKGVEACFNRSKNELISEEVSRGFCAEKHQRQISSHHIGGNGRISKKQIIATLINNNKGDILTAVELSAFFGTKMGK